MLIMVLFSWAMVVMFPPMLPGAIFCTAYYISKRRKRHPATYVQYAPGRYYKVRR